MRIFFPWVSAICLELDNIKSNSTLNHVQPNDLSDITVEKPKEKVRLYSELTKIVLRKNVKSPIFTSKNRKGFFKSPFFSILLT